VIGEKKKLADLADFADKNQDFTISIAIIGAICVIGEKKKLADLTDFADRNPVLTISNPRPSARSA
jgi:hypothetical protein